MTFFNYSKECGERRRSHERRLMRWLMLFVVLALLITACCLKPNIPCIPIL